MSLVSDNLRPESLLAQLERGWRERGWMTSDLARFRMEGEADPPTPPVADPPKNEPAKEFTQDDLNRIAAREKAEGQRAAEKAMAEQLGCTVDEAKKLLDAHREAELGKMTEAERKLDEAKKAEQKATEREAAAAEREHKALLAEALADAGVKKDRKAGAIRLIDVPSDADEKAIAAAVDDCKKAYPEFFGESKTDPPAPRRVPSGDPKGTPPRQVKGEDTFEKRRIEAAKRQGYKETA